MPLLDEAAAAPFAAIAAIAAFTLHDGPVFDLFARPGEHREQRLYGLIGFTLAATGLVLLSAVSAMDAWIPVGTIVLVAYGNLGVQLARQETGDPVTRVVGFTVVGGLACAVAGAAALAVDGRAVEPMVAELAFLGASGGLLGALLRTYLFETDDAYVMLTVGLWLWLLSTLTTDATLVWVGGALAVSAALGYASYALETASITGMLTGVTMALVTIVLGGIGWFVVLISFFGIGGLATKFRYDEKLERGIAEDDAGARSTANVLANGGVGFVALLAYAATTAAGLGHPSLPAVVVPSLPFLFAFLGGFATAMGDTLSSEVGGVFDGVRLITTLQRVEPGTDGGITWQGEVAGLAGAGFVALLSFALFEPVGATEAGIVLLAGFVGMTADSLLGATVEGGWLGNEAVNSLATLSGAVFAAVAAVALGFA